METREGRFCICTEMMKGTTMNEAKMTELTQAEEMAFFRADLCLYSAGELHARREEGNL